MGKRRKGGRPRLYETLAAEREQPSHPRDHTPARFAEAMRSWERRKRRGP